MTSNSDTRRPVPVGRFAPSPSGRMHLGNIYTALLSWLSVKSRGGRWILRIEDLDPQRSKIEWARLIEDDLSWLGLEWDEGGIDGKGSAGPYRQSERTHIYEHYLERLVNTGFTYKCTCTRADIMATQAPHQSDGRIIYAGTCRPQSMPCHAFDHGASGAVRLYVPDSTIAFDDMIAGRVEYNLARDCGDFVLRRADGAWAYQLAVVVDDALMGVNEVMRGDDLILSAAQQIYLYRLFGFEPPRFAHLPLVLNDEGVRLSKRDSALGMDALRERYTPSMVIGLAAHRACLIPSPQPVSLSELMDVVKRKTKACDAMI